MELIELKNKICESFTGTTDELNHVLTLVSQDRSVFPFNEYEHLILSLIALGGLTYNQYLEIRTEYISENPYFMDIRNLRPHHLWQVCTNLCTRKISSLKNPLKENRRQLFKRI